MPTEFTNAAGQDDDAGMALKLVCLELLALCVASGLLYFTKNWGVGVVGFMMTLLSPFAYALFRESQKEKVRSPKD
jgi:hypothetical protein